MIFETKISQISDHESQEVSSLPIFSTSFESLMFLGQVVNNFLLVLNLEFRTFKKNSAKTHFSWIKFHDLSYKIFFGFIDKFMELIFLLSLQRHTEHELLVINQSNTCWPNFRLRD